MTLPYSTYLTKRTILAFSVGVFTTVTLGYNLGLFTFSSTLGYDLPTHNTTYSGEVHVHADFRMYITDERIRFTDTKYQSEVGHALDIAQHFHDGNDEVIHRHADKVTLADFFRSLGVTLTDTCLTLETGTTYCTNESQEFMHFVNGTQVAKITEYITAEKDRILLYYGTPNNPRLRDYIAGVTDESCLYSRTCPERGEPPTEGCGLTCDVANIIHKQ